MERRSMSKIGAAAIMMAALATGAPAAGAVPAQQGQHQVKREARGIELNTPIVQEESKNYFRNAGKYRGPAGRFLNQRQYRKRWRQSPHKRPK